MRCSERERQTGRQRQGAGARNEDGGNMQVGRLES